MKSRPFPDLLADTAVRRVIRQALAEDLGEGDVTSQAVIPRNLQTRAVLLTREPAVVSGASVAAFAFRCVDKKLRVRIHHRDGERVKAGEVLLEVSGSARSILAAERVALNFMQRMCGIATRTAEYVMATQPHRAAILDTRKTTPLLRAFEKHAVRCGGGWNHRSTLSERVLIKDNHRALGGGKMGRLSLCDAVRLARRAHPDVPVEVEVETLSELDDALAGGPDWILLDNMSPAQARAGVSRVAGRANVEASGGITLQTVARYAATGVDAISIGALTHSAPAIDLSLEIPHGSARR